MPRDLRAYLYDIAPTGTRAPARLDLTGHALTDRARTRQNP
jgi:hypothetical protein